MVKKRVLVAVALLAVGIAAVQFWPRQQRPGEDTTAVIYGNVEIREAQLAFNASEHIKEILVEEGDRVIQGQVLAQLHTELLDAQLAEMQATLQAQQQLVAKLNAGNRPEEILEGEAQLRAARAHAKSAADSYQRMRTLLAKKLAAEEDVENMSALADVASAQAEAAKQALILLRLGPRTEDIAIAQAQLLARQAALTAAQQRRNNATLYAPADGVIRNRILEPGDMAFPSMPALTLAFTQPVWVRAYLPETMLGRVKLGARAAIHTDSYPDKPYQGWVGFISPTAEFTPKTVQTPELRTRLVYSMRVFACNPEDELRLGMPVTVSLALDQTIADDNTNHCGD
ncbi:MAG: hemolysin D [Gammaproteobacteria bacterium]|nr:MAG: hemolysin D [Gammaproteobacteria bacterium]RLA13053.1 MAG: hemolysin D [Gammaproteobacteria bacterium]RLA13055.1 MAG: hemolysin D [Gammaproteobacteria bacterium]